MGGILLALLGMAACAAPAVPDPKPVVARYARALRQGDAQAVYQMLSTQAQRQLGQQGVKALLAAQRAELTAQAQALQDERAQVHVEGRARFVDGQIATFTVEQGELKLQAAAALPARATTPAQALSELRAALERRSYAALMMVLTRDSAGGFEDKLRSLVTALQNPEALEIHVEAGRAVIELPQGHRVELRKEDGLWKVRDFE